MGMFTFVQWAKDIDGAFRAFYPTVALEGEVVEDEPRRNDTHYLLGTSRLDDTGRAALAAMFTAGVILTDSEPEGF